MTKPKITILVVDDRPVRRQRLGKKLDDESNFEVVGQMSCRLKIPPDLFDFPANIVAISEEVAKKLGDRFLEENRALPNEPLVQLAKLIDNPKTKVVRFGDDTDFALLIAQINKLVPNCDITGGQPTSYRNRRLAVPVPIIAIGASTGGVDALTSVLARIPKDCPPILVVQHMKPSFTAGFALRMNSNCIAEVATAKNAEMLKPGRIYIAPGGQHLEVVRGGGGVQCRVFDDERQSSHTPSVDVLFESIAKLRGPRIGVLLTGMGRDGAQGLLKMRELGCATIGQDEQSSVVYGMPRVAHEIGATDMQLPLDKIGEEITRLGRELVALAAVL